MYSGHYLIYVLKSNIDDLRDIFEIEEEIDEEISSIYEFIDICNQILEDYKFLKILKMPCCYFDDNELFIGVHLGEMSVQYRDNIEKYSNLEEYLERHYEKLKKIESVFVDNRNLIDNEVDKIFNEYPKISEYFSKSNFEFITIPNDCESCT